MSTLLEIQSRFAAGVFQGSEEILADLLDDGRQAARFAVYRNNTHASILEVLADAFPTVKRLLGARLFTRLVTAFIHHAPSRANHLLDYGAELPDFIALSEALAEQPWLPDVARLDWARNAAYGAAEATATDAGALQGLTAEALMALRPELIPSATLLTSDWPIHAIWMTADAASDGTVARRPEAVLVARPAMQVQTSLLHPAEHALLLTLQGGGTLGEAAVAAQQTDPAFDLMTAFAGHLSAGIFTHRGNEDPTAK
ncbi:MAG: DNA-binding domain-containing protein [Minwuia sp.]|nr:DNA-binding domain-containing protein [Minwuia sp.]